MSISVSIQKKFTIALFVCALFSLSFLFVSQMIQKAASKPFWLDENFSLGLEKEFGDKTSVRTHSYGNMLMKGAPWQGSSAPLDYFIVKAMDQIGEANDKFGLPFNVFHRLHTIFYFVIVFFISGLFLLSRTVKNFDAKESVSLAGFLICYFLIFFDASLNYYAVEMRPYALWINLWMAIIFCIIFGRLKSKTFYFLWILLALTVSSAIFHIISFGCVVLMINLIEKKSFKDTIIYLLKVLAIPMMINFYYVFTNHYEWWYHKSDLYYLQFTHFWKDNIWVGLLSLVGFVFVAGKKNYRNYTIVFAVFLFMFALGPLINHMTIQRGFFFAPRQYLYYHLTIPFFIFIGFEMIVKEWMSGGYFKYVINKSRLPLIIGVLALLGINNFMTRDVQKRKRLEKLIPDNYTILWEAQNPKSAFNEKDLGAYIDYYDEIVNVMPYQWEAYGLLGYCFYYLKHWQKAEHYYVKALAFHEDFNWFWFNLAVIYFQQENYVNALSAIKEFKKHDIKNTLPRILNSQKLYLPIYGEKYDLITNSFKDNLTRANAQIHQLETEILKRLQQWEEVYKNSIGGSKQFKQQEDYYYNYALLSLLRMEKYDQAYQLFVLLVNQKKINKSVLTLGAELLKRLGKSDQMSTLNRLEQAFDADINPFRMPALFLY